MLRDLSLREAGPQDLEVVYALVCQLEEKQFPFVEFESLFAANCGDENVRC